MRLHLLLLVLLICLVVVDSARKKKPGKRPASKPAKKPARKPAKKAGPKPAKKNAKKTAKKPAKPSAIKGSCKNVGKEANPKIFEKYTVKGKQCPCWWNIERKDCACCEEGVGRVQQCGYPMHRYCYKREDRGNAQVGCPGVCNNAFTLSTKGYPCFSDRSNKDCAWCNEVGFQCAQDRATGPDSKRGSRCQRGSNTEYCESQQGDCKHIPPCDVNAECNLSKRMTKKINYYQCECKKGYTGNGIQCQDANGTLSADPNSPVNVQIKLTSAQYMHPHIEGEFTYGNRLEEMFGEMVSANQVCKKDDQCKGSYNQQTIAPVS